MLERRVSGIILTLLLIGMLTFELNAQPVKASDGTYFIKADGSVYPDDGTILRDRDLYTLTRNIASDSDGIVIERDNITLDGAGYTLHGLGSGNYNEGIDASNRNNVTIKNIEITAFYWGIWIIESSDNSIIGNNVTANNRYGIRLASSNNNRIIGNNITANNDDGILFSFSSNNNISGNNITANKYDGIWLSSSNNNRIIGNNITANNDNSIGLSSSNSNRIVGNNVANNNNGIWLYFSSNNSIFGNNIADNNNGIGLYFSNNNCIVGNNVVNNDDGIWLYPSSNKIYHNNFVGNERQVYVTHVYANIWDDGYPSGGNYWSDYTDADLYFDYGQNEVGSDGIGDTPYYISANNIDYYPLMGTFTDFNVTSEHSVQTICNSTISDFQFNCTAILFNVSGKNGTTGFCRICIPTVLLNGNYTVFVNGTKVDYDLLPFSNSTHSYLYFTCFHSTQEVIIIPEFPSFFILPIFMIAILLTLIIHKRKHSR